MTTSQALKQHLIDPEICIRCNTCEETCPVGAITHDNNNYVVDATKCNLCLDCISPCPTGSIDNWRVVADAFSLDEQFSWSELPAAREPAGGDVVEAIDDEVDALLTHAHAGAGGKSIAPASALKPSINLFNRGAPAIATCLGNYRLTAPDADNDVRHLILSFAEKPFPVLEGQSVGVVPPGVDAKGEPHRIRLYSIASPRHGEKPNTYSIALTVKREPLGLCSNYLCDLKKGDRVEITGPFGATFLMPNDPAANIIMICTGTGSAPFRGFTEWRRRTMPNAPGRMMLFFGARRPEELPYFGPLQKVPETLLAMRFAYSRVPGEPKTYVQDVLRREADDVATLMQSPLTHVYVCGLKGMEQGVDAALDDICRAAGISWATLRPDMRASGRYHVETY
jgi:benzoyl-CoA 2,3-dioxygenase component A